MDELFKILLIVAGMFGFFVWERRYQRIGDLTKTLEAILRELKNDKYVVTECTLGELTVLELSNDISRITHRNFGNNVVIECNLFFTRKEDRGANKTVLSRNCKTPTKVSYLRRNELLGRVLYRHDGTTSNPKVEHLMNDIINEIKKHTLQ